MNERPFSDFPDGVVDAAMDRAALAKHAERGAMSFSSREQEAIRRLLRLICGSRPASPKVERMVGRRALVLAWLMHPDQVPGLEGTPISIRTLAQKLRVSHAAALKVVHQIQAETDLENCYLRSHGRQRRGNGGAGDDHQ
ncbi:MAG: hypothetical protein KIT22_09455 [Verrucomicrobiae bacterium]|nr:hypothetical protein [Verrucomicrobiae bacterium]